MRSAIAAAALMAPSDDLAVGHLRAEGSTRCPDRAGRLAHSPKLHPGREPRWLEYTPTLLWPLSGAAPAVPKAI